MGHVILGAGKFSKAHIRLLSEYGINELSIAKKTEWSDNKKDDFVSMFPNCKINFLETYQATKQDMLHIVTPSDTHLQNMLFYAEKVKSIFVEKPAVLFNNEQDYESANLLLDTVIYHNDWLSQITDNLNTVPKNIKFSYHVANKDNINLWTEVLSHVVIMCSKWVSPFDEISVIYCHDHERTLQLELIFSGKLTLEVDISSGFLKKSKWHCQIDDYEYSSDNDGGRLMNKSFGKFINSNSPLTDWYKSSWLLHRIKYLNNCEDFSSKYLKHYKRKL
jgi:hypothetical protein